MKMIKKWSHFHLILSKGMRHHGLSISRLSPEIRPTDWLHNANNKLIYNFIAFSSTPSLPSASSDEDIDPELREGIHNIM